MEFKMSKQFTSELEDQNSAAFTELANEVTSKLNEVYSKKFGDSFKETVIKKFSQGSVVADVELIFNEVNSVPDASSVVDTLVNATSDSNFDLNVDTSSISAKVVLPPTQAPTTVVPSTPTSASPLTDNTTSPPITMTSPPLSATSPPLSATSPPITMTSPPLSATSPPITMTSPPLSATSPPITMTSPPLSSTSPPIKMTSPPLSATSPPITMTSPPLSATSPPIKMTSPPLSATSPPITMTSPPLSATSPPVTTMPLTGASTATTSTVTTTASTNPPSSSEGTLGLQFSLNKIFTADLSNPSSTAFQTLAASVVAEVNKVNKRLYGSLFDRSIVNSFREGSVVVDMTLVYKDKSSVPSESNATSALSKELTSNSTSLNVIPSSISTTSSAAASTAAPNTTASITVAPNATAAPTSASTTTITTATATTKTATTTASTNPPSSSEGTLGLQFSLNKIFSADLSNPSSTAFQTLAATVVTEVNKVGKRLYGSLFARSIVNSFREGSVVANMTLVYKDKSSVPSASSATSAFSTELTSNSTSLNIIPGSVSAQSTTTSSSPPRPTMVAMTVLSLTLLAVAQMLVDL
ncbi:hypothetical protein PAMA_016401 [Pampus argenteus]